MGLNYRIVDVFTDRPFGGNPLAVVLEADRLSSAEMQSIAREFNLSETVFVLKAQSPGHTARVRIFTPSREIPFAGHPTLGTATLLAQMRLGDFNGERDAIIALEEEIGSVRVGVRARDGAPAYGEFDAPKLPDEPHELTLPEEIAAAIGLIPTELGFENHKPMMIKGSSTFAYVPVASLEAMSKLRIAPVHWVRAFTDRHIDGVYVYTRQCVRAHAAFHARMFAPDYGIPEDPATGSAAVGFARIIHAFDALPEGSHKRTVEQGLEMGRPSSIQLIIAAGRGKLDGVRIGGYVVPVAQGTLEI